MFGLLLLAMTLCMVVQLCIYMQTSLFSLSRATARPRSIHWKQRYSCSLFSFSFHEFPYLSFTYLNYFFCHIFSMCIFIFQWLPEIENTCNKPFIYLIGNHIEARNSEPDNPLNVSDEEVFYFIVFYLLIYLHMYFCYLFTIYLFFLLPWIHHHISIHSLFFSFSFFFLSFSP